MRKIDKVNETMVSRKLNLSTSGIFEFELTIRNMVAAILIAATTIFIIAATQRRLGREGAEVMVFSFKEGLQNPCSDDN
jgi:hypothetical protein